MREQVAELCRRLAPLIPDQVNALWAGYVAETSAEGRNEITQTLELMAARHLGLGFDHDRQPFPPPPREWTEAGEIAVGDVLYGGESRFPLRLPIDSLTTHALVCGRSGSGKSVLTMHLARGIMRRKIICTIFDWKRSYRDLLRQVPEGTLRVYTPGRESVAPLRWNPLIPPPGCEPMLYAKLIVDVICRALLGGEGVISLLHRGMEYLYTKYGVLTGEIERYPTIMDLLDWIEHTKLTGRAGMWKASAERILRAMTYGDFGKMMDCQSSADMLMLLESNTVIELDGLAGAADRQLFAEGVTLWIYRYLLARGERPGLERMWIHEEAHQLLSQSETGAQETVLEQALRLVRAYGVGIVVVDQQCSMLSKTVFANCGTMFCLNQKLRSDVQAMVGALNLSPQQREAVSTLPVGTTVARLPEGHPEPFLVKIPPPPPLPGGGRVSDAELAQRAKHFTSVVKATVEQQIADDVIAVLSQRRSRSGYSDSPTESPRQSSNEGITAIPLPDKYNQRKLPEPHPPFIGEVDLVTHDSTDPVRPLHSPTHPPETIKQKHSDPEPDALLADIIEHPLSTTVERYERLKLSRRRGHALRTHLVDVGFIEPVRIPTRSGNVVLLGLTDRGRQHAQEHDLSPPPAPREGLEHRYWVSRVAVALRTDGYEVQVEYPVKGNGRVDLWANLNSRSLQVEIETGRSSIITNLKKCVGHADGIILVATNPSAASLCAAAIERLSLEEVSRVELRTWLDYS